MILLSLTILLFLGTLLWLVGVPCLFVYLYNKSKDRWFGLYYGPVVTAWFVLNVLLSALFFACAKLTGYIP